MKWLFYLTVFYAGILSVKAQEETNNAHLSFETKSGILTDAVGWDSTLGRWTDNKNLISLIKGQQVNGYVSNFKWIQTGVFRYNQKKYYIFYAAYVAGQYKDLEKKENWHDFNALKYLMLDSLQYSRLKATLKSKNGETTFIYAELIGEKQHFKGDFDESNFLQHVLEDMNLALSLRIERSFGFPLSCQKLGEKDVVRFNWPKISLDKDDLQDHYFEVPLVEFQKLLID